MEEHIPTKQDLLMLIKDQDIKISNVKNWIKHTFSTLEALPENQIDIKENYLNEQLSVYYNARKTKEGLLKYIQELDSK